VFHLSFLSMISLNQTYTGVFSLRLYLCFQEIISPELFISTVAGVLNIKFLSGGRKMSSRPSSLVQLSLFSGISGPFNASWCIPKLDIA